jgi:hypothetical protein
MRPSDCRSLRRLPLRWTVDGGRKNGSPQSHAQRKRFALGRGRATCRHRTTHNAGCNWCDFRSCIRKFVSQRSRPGHAGIANGRGPTALVVQRRVGIAGHTRWGQFPGLDRRPPERTLAGSWRRGYRGSHSGPRGSQMASISVLMPAWPRNLTPVLSFRQSESNFFLAIGLWVKPCACARVRHEQSARGVAA